MKYFSHSTPFFSNYPAKASRIFCSLITLVCISATIRAESIKGKITDLEGNPLVGVTVRLLETGKGTTTDLKGKYQIDKVPTGKYTLEVSYVGFEKISRAISIKPSERVNLDFSLEEDVSELGEVVVRAKSESKVLSEKPLQITSIDMRELQVESADAVAILDRATGVRVRQTGGLGSNTNVQLNGLTGLAVRTYYDGIPIELFGGAIQLNNIPVNNIQRIDVYKGVMPVDVGTDALAGGINIVSKKGSVDKLDASYQVGSFNTHVGTLNVSKKLNEHLYVSLSGFYNYSDNNYKVRAEQRTPDFKVFDVEVERFHNVHQSSMMNGTVGLTDVKFADHFSYSIGYAQRYDEVQHGIRLTSKAVGEATIERGVIMHDIRYEKALFNDKLNLDYSGHYIITNENLEDSTSNVYDWFGNVTGTNGQGVEVLAAPSLREGETTAHAHRLNVVNTISPSQKVKLSSFFSNEEVVGSDPLAQRINEVDPNTVPSFLTRSISGISHEAKWLKSKKLETELFGKFYYYEQRSTDFRPSGSDRIFEYFASGRETGFGFGVKYSFLEDWFVRTSYEEALRIPTRDEVFGNFLTIEPNFFLKPEESNNLNVGTFYQHAFSSDQFISLDASWFLRDQSNLIRLAPGRNENDPAQFINEAEVDATGWEFTLKGSPIKDLLFTFSYTAQEIIRAGEKDQNDTNGVGDPIPNRPLTFFNLSSRYSFKSPFVKQNRIIVFGYYNFVEEFDLIFQNTRNPENIIPTQRQLDLGFTYKITRANLNLSFQSSNVLDEEVFDNFRVPRPGRSYQFKIQYSLNSF